MSRPDKFPDCMALSSKREACLGYRETFTKLDLAEKEIERLRAVLKEIQAYSVGDPRPRHTWYYDCAEAALADGQSSQTEK